MSAFIVDFKSINKIVTWIDRSISNNDILSSEVRELLKKNNITLGYQKDLQFLANAFYFLNKIAVDTRYDENTLIQVMRYNKEEATDIQVLKSLHCLCYQCSEGEVPSMKLFKVIEKLIRILERHIINELPEYKNAEWC